MGTPELAAKSAPRCPLVRRGKPPFFSARATLMLAALVFKDNVIYSIQSGKTGFEKAHGVPLFEYLEKHPGRITSPGCALSAD